MIVCPNCKKQLPDDTKFCDACGARILEKVFCPSCGAANTAQDAFCQNCGTPLSAQQTPAKAQKKPMPKKALVLGAIAAALVVVVVLLICLLPGGESSNRNFGLYLKDGEMLYTDFSKDGAFEVTSNLMKNIDVNSDFYHTAGSGAISRYVVLSKDGSRLFFPDKLESTSVSSVTLYYRDVNKPKADAEKIASDVSDYYINEKGTKIVYKTGEDGNLYLSDLNEKQKIAADVSSFYVSKNLEKVIYRTQENDCYVWFADKGEKEKLASDVTELYGFSDGYGWMYYAKDDSLYRQQVGGEERQKISSDVHSISRVYEDGTVYYYKQSTMDIPLTDLVTDDTYEQDQAVLDALDSGYWDPDYEDEMAAGWARIELRRELNDWAADSYADYDDTESWEDVPDWDDDYGVQELTGKISAECYELYCFDGEDTALVSDRLRYPYLISYSVSEPLVVFSAFSEQEHKKLKLSEISDTSEVSLLFSEAYYNTYVNYIASGATVIELPSPDAHDCRVAGNNVYYLDEPDDMYGTLYRVSVKGDKCSEPERINSDVYSNEMSVFDDKLVYYKDVDEDSYTGTLYLDEEEVAEDVSWGAYTQWNDTLVYYSDSSSDSSTLCIFKDGKSETISEDVYAIVTAGDSLLYLYDYSTNHFTGELFRYHDGKTEKLDEDVTALLRIYTYRMK